MVFCILISKAIFISSLIFRLSSKILLISLSSPRHLSKNKSSFRLGSGHFDELSSLFYSVVFDSEVTLQFTSSPFITLAWACETTFSLLNINSSTKRYHRHFSDHCNTDFIFIALSSLYLL